ncbi:Polyprenol monophosphomannose synthase [Pseudoclavibacter triregionum]|nr:Polyprenol monophosphomannose synthase [Pseudoclavibacter triregionum]
MTTALVILPTYNERENLDMIVQRVLDADPRISVLIVDDNSPDGTGELADAFAERDERVTVLHRPGKLGLGTAYLEGFAIAIERGFDYAFEFDADGSHPADRLPACLDALDAGADLVIGTRWIPGGKTENWPLYRQLISRGASIYARVLLRSKLHDLTAGFRGYRTSALAEAHLETVRSAGYCFQIETAWMFERRGYDVVEIPITFVERELGASKMSSGIIVEALWRVLAWGVGSRLADVARLFGGHR